LFASEVGGMRWQRVPPTEKRGRVHTSTITVAVLPEPSPTEVCIDPADLDWSTCRGSGSGGQKRNKTESTVQLYHRPSGIRLRVESGRSQARNREDALALLRARLYEREQSARAAARDRARREMVGSGMRADKRRTVAVQRDQVVDHVTGRQTSWRNYCRGIFPGVW
jgi:peptide chain release factor 1